MIIMSEKYQLALKFAEEKHEGQFRRGGKKYITHPVAVAEILKEKGYGEEYIIAALFHDLLEDTDASEEDILRLGSPAILEAVKLVTKEKGYSQKDYIERIKADKIAFAVKTADRLHNLRSAHEADDSFIKRYIEDTLLWYSDFGPEITEAVQRLKARIKE